MTDSKANCMGMAELGPKELGLVEATPKKKSRGGRLPGSENRNHSDHPKTVKNRNAVKNGKDKKKYMLEDEKIYEDAQGMVPKELLFEKDLFSEDTEKIKTAKQHPQHHLIKALHERLGKKQGSTLVTESVLDELAHSGLRTHSAKKYKQLLDECSLPTEYTVAVAMAALSEWLEKEKENQAKENEKLAEELEKVHIKSADGDKKTKKVSDCIEHREGDDHEGDDHVEGDEEAILITSKEMMWQVVCKTCGLHGSQDYAQQFVEFCRRHEVEPIAAFHEVCFDLLQFQLLDPSQARGGA